MGKRLIKLTGLLLLLIIVAGSLLALRQETPLQAGGNPATCPPLPAPTGTIVYVSSVSELQTAVNNLQSNSTILIADGVYELTNTLVIDGVNNVGIRGASGNRTQVILRGRGMSNSNYGNVPHGFLIAAANDVTIADLTVREFYFHDIQVQGEKGPQRPLLYNLHLVDAGEQIVKVSTAGAPGPYADDGLLACSILEYGDRARSWYTNGIDVLAGANWTVRDNEFRRIRAPIGQLAGPAVLFWRNSINTVVERNLFIDCDRGIALGLSTPDGNARDGESTYDHQGGAVRNNFIWQNPDSPTADVGITVNYARDYAIYHNTVLLNETFPWAIEYRFTVSNGDIGNNLTDGPIQKRDGASATLFGNVANASLSWFVDATSGDLHLLPTAVNAIDMAISPAVAVDDYDGEARPYGVAADVGADELNKPPFIATDWYYLPVLRGE